MNNQDSRFNLLITSEERLNSVEAKLEEVLNALKKIQPQSHLPNMLTSEQVMDVLKIGRWKFDQLIADNALKYIRKGRKIYVYDSSIREYFKSQ